MKLHTKTKKFLFAGGALLATLVFSFLLADVSVFKWNEEGYETLSAQERTELLGLNQEFDVVKAHSLSDNVVLGEAPGLPLKASVLFRGEQQREAGTEILVETQSGNIVLLESAEEIDPTEMTEAYAELPSVVTAEANLEGTLFEDSTSGTSATFRPEETASTGSSKTVTVAVIDSGIDVTHPAFSGNLWTNTAEQYGKKGVDDDRNGFVDDIHGWNFVGNTADISDGVGHGTHVTGIIGAQKTNLSDMQGVSPDHTRLMILKIADRTGGLKLSNVIAALNYAASEGADVTNMSFGFSQYSALLQNMIEKAKQKNIFLIAAAGNSNSDSRQYPAAYPQVFSIGATRVDGGKWPTSNFGSWVDASVPGKLLSTIPLQNYGIKSGTSQSAALMTGQYALYKSKFPEKSPYEIEKILKRYSEQFEEEQSLSSIQALSSVYSWVQSAADITRQRRHPTATEYTDLELNRRITVSEIRLFLLELFQAREEVLEVLRTREVPVSTTAISPNSLMDSWYTNYLFSESESRSLNVPKRIRPKIQFVKTWEAKSLLLALREKFYRNGFNGTLFADQLMEGTQDITRGEFLELVYQVFVDYSL